MSSIIDTAGIGAGGGAVELELIATSPALPTTAPSVGDVVSGQWEIADTDNWQRINTNDYKGIYFIIGGSQSGSYGSDVHPKGTSGYLFVPLGQQRCKALEGGGVHAVGRA